MQLPPATRWLSLALTLTTTTVISPLVAQSCFTGRPVPQCRSFWITEAGFSVRLDDHPNKDGGSVTFDLGYAVNIGGQSALGVSGFLRGGEPVGGGGIRGRYRLWLGGATSLDLAPGILLASSGGQFDYKAGTFSGQVALNVTRGFGLVAQVDQVRLASNTFTFPNGETTDVAWYAGGRLSGGAGLGGILAFLALGALVAATW